MEELHTNQIVIKLFAPNIVKNSVISFPEARPAPTIVPINNARIVLIPKYINIPTIINIVIRGIAINNKTMIVIPIDLINLFILEHF